MRDPRIGASRDADEREAAASLTVGNRQKRLRRFWRSIPSPPRCKTCHRPFAGVGGPVMRLIGLGPWPGNPKYCRGCFRQLYRTRAGAEIECSLLFADVRNSTALAETMPPAEFRRLMDRFYETAFGVLVARDAFVDKFVGDEVIGIFVPVMTDGHHAQEAIEAARDLLRATGHAGSNPWIPVGIGVNTGIAYVGAVGTDEHVEFTALGDVVNVTARLSAAAGAGELLVTGGTMRAAQLSDDGLEHRRLELKGKSEATEVVVLTAAP
ncbi:MAG TPA: adenylate/guanylate cyclase domain-containing protein [Candidatus Limnocylindria bacterium]|nr:adenylate/guanylate cyclase domain-containing protein [Candidatus Limnocylindria bacterium]